MRRFSLSTSWLVLAVLVVPGSRASAQSDYETTRIAEGVYQYRWQAHNGFFVVTPEGVVAFDPISVDAATQYALEIQRVAPGVPLRAIVYSHSDADHATGARALMDGMGREVPIIAQRRAAPRVRAAGSPDLPEPTITFAETLVLGGELPVELRYLGRSHSDNMVIGYVPDAGVAFAVDFIANDRMGYRDLPGWYFPEFFTTLSRVLELDFKTIVFGHGPPGDRASVQRQVAYYDDLRAAVAEAVAAGWSEDRAVAEIRLPQYADWDQYDAWFPMNVRAVYRWWTAGER
jgi:glyoxylase-like metal-dependent hydrolase (beta-lactamase superfamily II)